MFAFIIRTTVDYIRLPKQILHSKVISFIPDMPSYHLPSVYKWSFIVTMTLITHLSPEFSFITLLVVQEFVTKPEVISPVSDWQTVISAITCTKGEKKYSGSKVIATEKQVNSIKNKDPEYRTLIESNNIKCNDEPINFNYYLIVFHKFRQRWNLKISIMLWLVLLIGVAASSS